MKQFHNKTDAELVLLTLENPDNFLHLMDRYESKFLRYIKRLVGVTHQDAEDILQEVFIKIYRNLNDFDQDLKFSSWAYRIAHNEAINYIKKHSGKETLPLETDDEDAVSLIEVISSDTDIPDDFSRKELAAKVRTVLYSLSEKYREVLILRYLEDKDYAEISDILKKPMGSVATLINRAKEQFKMLAEKNNLNLQIL